MFDVLSPSLLSAAGLSTCKYLLFTFITAALLCGRSSCDSNSTTTDQSETNTSAVTYNTSASTLSQSQTTVSTNSSSGIGAVLATGQGYVTGSSATQILSTQSVSTHTTESSMPYSDTRWPLSSSPSSSTTGNSSFDSFGSNQTTVSSTVATHSKTPGNGGIRTDTLIGIVAGAIAFLILIFGILFLIWKYCDSELFINKSSQDQPFSITMEFWDDKFGFNYLNGHIELPKDTPEEMIQSLDNDSFLNSLENITYNNYQAFQTKNTKV